MKRGKVLWSISLYLLLCFPMATYAQQSSVPPPPSWWQVAGGVLAIPTSLIGLIYSYALFRKTGLESRKIELEILEKAQQLETLKEHQDEATRAIVRPLIRNQFAQNIILRFIILYLVNEAYSFFESGYEIFVSGVVIGITKFAHVGLGEPFIVIPMMLVENLPQIGRLMVFLAIGLPLFRDVNKQLGLDIKSVFRLRGANTHRTEMK